MTCERANAPIQAAAESRGRTATVLTAGRRRRSGVERGPVKAAPVPIRPARSRRRRSREHAWDPERNSKLSWQVEHSRRPVASASMARASSASDRTACRQHSPRSTVVAGPTHVLAVAGRRRVDDTQVVPCGDGRLHRGRIAGGDRRRLSHSLVAEHVGATIRGLDNPVLRLSPPMA